MTKLLLVGDIHFRSKRLNEISDAWERLIGHAKSNGFDYVIQAGDVFDHPNIFGKEATTGTIYDAFLAPFVDDPLPFFAIPGNHDMGGPRDCDAISAINACSWANVKRKPGVYPIIENGRGGVVICAIPWISRAALMAKLVAARVPPKDAKSKVESAIAAILPVLAKKVKEFKDRGYCVILISHVEVTGARLGHGQVQSDGAFEFSPAGLAKVGADAYGLGHIHIRQGIPGLPRENDGYLGTICQLSFGEGGNTVGARVLELDDDWKIAKDYWLDNKSSPRYHTVEDIGDAEYRDGVDHVKVKGDKRPDDLPDDVIFEKKPDRSKREAVDTSLDSDSPVDKLLGEWHEATSCPIPMADLMAGLVGMNALQSMSSVGSLNRINRITLQNVTCHKDTNIDLSEVEGVIGVQGPNGAGKTSAMESMLLALYGSAPSRSLAEMISTYDSGPSMVEMEFESGGDTYIVRRDFKAGKKSTSHKGLLVKKGDGDDEDEALAGPNATPVTKECSVKVGDKDLVLAGMFASQDDTGNIVELDPADRKELFAKYLGTDKFIKAAEDIRSQAKADLAKAEAHEGRAAALEEDLKGEDKDKALLEEAIQLKEKQETFIANQKKDISRCREERAKAEIQAEKHKDALNRKGQVEDELHEANMELARLNDNVPLENAERQLAEAREAKERLSVLKAKYADLKQKKTELLEVAADRRASASSLKASRAKAYSDAVKHAQESLEELRTERNERTLNSREKLRDLRSKAEVVAAEIKAMEDATRLLRDFPDEEVCRTCPLARAGIMARDGVPAKEEEAKAIAERISNGRSKLQKFDEKTEEMLSKISIPDEEDFDEAALAMIEAMEKGAEDKSKEAEAISLPADEIEEIKGLKEKAGMLESLEKSIPEMQSAETDKANAKASIASLEKEWKSLKAKIDGIKMANIGEMDKKLKTLEEDLDEMSKVLMRYVSDIGKQEAKVESYQKMREDLAKASKEAGELKKNGEARSVLAQAFGRDGIPQMLVERTLPRFQDIMADLMEELDGGWSIRVSSQKTTGKGTTKETIDILVDDGIKERDVKTYSGAEKRILKYVIRVAFAILQAEKHGKGLKVMVIDEAFDTLEDEYVFYLLGMLDKLTKYFNQIFVISHNASLLSGIPMKVKFDGGRRRVSSVQVIAARS